MVKLLLGLATFLVLAACGGGGMSGKYACQDVGLGFIESVELTSDGKAYTTAGASGVTQQTAGIYEVDGSRLLIHVDGAPSTVVDVVDGDLVFGGGKCVKAQT